MLKRVVVLVGLILGIAASIYVPRTIAARNTGGTYSLPSGNPVVSGTTITPTWANSTLSDVGTELTNSLDRSGRGSMSGALKLAAGSVSAPGLTFSVDADTGLFRNGSNDLRMSVDSTYIQKWATTGATFPRGLICTQAQTNTAGLVTTGNGTGAGITATGGGTGNGITATGGGGSAYGGDFLGGSTAGAGVNAVGGGTGQGGVFTGGSGGGAGIVATATGNGIGGQFSGSGTGAGIQVGTGYAKFNGSNPSADTGFTNTVTPTNIVKAWGSMTSGAGTWGIGSGFNITNPQCSSKVVTVDLVDDMADTTFIVLASGSSASGPGIWYKAGPNAAAGTIAITAWGCSGTSGCTVTQHDLCSSSETLQFIAIGPQ